MSGLLAVVNASEDDFNKLSDAIYNSTGEAERMSKEMQDNLKGRLTELKSAIEGVALQIYDAMLPALEKIVAAVKKVVDWFANLSPEVRAAMVVIAGLAAAIGPVLIVLGMMAQGLGAITSVVGTLSAALPVLGAAIGAITAPVAIAIGAIAALIAIGVLLWKNWEEVSAKAKEIWTAISEFFERTLAKISEVCTATWNTIQDITEAVWTGIKDFFATIWGAIEAIFTWYIETYISIITTAWEAIATVTSTVWEGIKTFFSTTWEGIRAIFDTTLSALTSFISTSWDNIKTATSETWNAIASALENIWGSIRGVADSIWQGIADSIKGTINGISAIINKWIGFINNIKIKVPRIKIPFVGTFGGWTVRLPQIPEIPALAKGGIVTKQMLAMVGEAGPEAVIPLKELKKMITDLAGEGRPGKGDIHQIINVHSPGPLTPYETARQVKNASRLLALEW